MDDRLKILKQILKGALQDSIMKTDVVRNCKIMYTDTIDNMQDALKNGMRQFERHIKSLTDIMDPFNRRLIEL